MQSPTVSTLAKDPGRQDNDEENPISSTKASSSTDEGDETPLQQGRYYMQITATKRSNLHSRSTIYMHMLQLLLTTCYLTYYMLLYTRIDQATLEKRVE